MEFRKLPNLRAGSVPRSCDDPHKSIRIPEGDARITSSGNNRSRPLKKVIFFQVFIEISGIRLRVKCTYTAGGTAKRNGRAVLKYS